MSAKTCSTWGEEITYYVSQFESSWEKRKGHAEVN